MIKEWLKMRNYLIFSKSTFRSAKNGSFRFWTRTQITNIKILILEPEMF